MNYILFVSSFFIVAVNCGLNCKAASMIDIDKDRRASAGSGSTEVTRASDETGSSGKTTLPLPSPKAISLMSLAPVSHDRPFLSVLTASDNILSTEERTFLSEITWRDLLFTGKYMPRPEREVYEMVDRVIKGDMAAIDDMDTIYYGSGNPKARLAVNLWGAYTILSDKKDNFIEASNSTMALGLSYDHNEFVHDVIIKKFLEEGKAKERHKFWYKLAQKNPDCKYASEALGELEAESIDPWDSY